MLQYIIRRLLWAAVMLVLVVAVVFTIFFVIPGGTGKREEGQLSPVAVSMAGRNPRPELVRDIEHRLGLDQPLYVQFGKYIGNAAQLDLGYSYQTQEPVREAVIRRAPATMSLAIGASIVWLVMGIATGIISALRRRSLLDRGFMVLALVGVSLPTFWLGLMAVFFFDSGLGIYSVGEYTGITESFSGWISALWLPWLVLAVVSAAFYTRMVRGNLLEVQGEDYIRTARAKGLKERSVIRHALRSALTPVVTMYGLDLGILLGGAVITESIFNIPGIGALAVDSISSSDLPMMLGTTVVAAFFVIAANLIVDVVYATLDPRVRYS
jgi:ABC-type dipeptide/oligopeptide/nickel transport system permease component